MKLNHRVNLHFAFRESYFLSMPLNYGRALTHPFGDVFRKLNDSVIFLAKTEFIHPFIDAFIHKLQGIMNMYYLEPPQQFHLSNSIQTRNTSHDNQPRIKS